MSAARLVTADNGYFEVWERPDGTRVRICTEYGEVDTAGGRTRFHAKVRARLSGATSGPPMTYGED